MEAVFLKICAMSLSACWLIGVVLVLRAVFRRAPKWIRGILWAMVALRLVCPVSLESPLSLIPQEATQAVQQVSAPAEQPTQSTAADPNQSIVPAETASVPWVGVLSWVWAGGMAGLLAYGGLHLLALRRRLREAVPLRENFYLCDSVDTPFLLGIFRPKIYLPAGLAPWMEGPVAAHELAHLRRRDHWWKPLGYLILCLHWFNPLVWLSYGLMSRDLELACDEGVIRNLDLEERKTYARALVSCSLGKRTVLTCPLAFGEGNVKQRVKAVLSYRKPIPWVAAVVVLVCAGVGICFLTDPLSTGQGESQGYYLILKADENTLVLDEVEWVTQESRAEELGLTQTFQDDGFCLYNPAEDGAQYSYAQACTFQLQDWSQGGGLTAVEKDVFLQTVTDRDESGLGEKIPYIVTLEKGKITDVTEQYVP